LVIGDWGLGPIPNPQSPIPNPQSPILWKIFIAFFNKKLNIILNIKTENMDEIELKEKEEEKRKEEERRANIARKNCKKKI